MRDKEIANRGFCTHCVEPQIETDGEDDQVHLLVEYPPKVAASNLVNSLKGLSSACCARSCQRSRGATGGCAVVAV